MGIPPGGSQSTNRISGHTAFRGAMVTSVWTLLSRILGFARDAVMLAVFGASAETGNFVIAWMVPNLFRRLFGEGAVSAAIQPALARAQEQDGEASARRLFASFQGVTAVFLLILVAVGEAILLGWHQNLQATPLSSNPEAALSRAADLQVLLLSAALLPYVLPICLTALAGAPQQLSGRFSLPALAPAALNAVWITWLLILGQGTSIMLLPIGVLFGGLVQWCMQFPGLKADGWPLLPRLDFKDPRLRASLRAFAPAVLGLAAVQLNLIVDQILVRVIVSDEANSFTYAANRLIQLPMALVGVAAATGVMPLFSRLAAEKRTTEITQALQRSCELTLMLMLAAGGGLFVLAVPTIRMLFEHGMFGPEDTMALTPVLRSYLWSLPAAALFGLGARVRQACGDLRGPARIAVMVIPVNLILDIILLPRMGVAGAGYATSVALTLQFFLLMKGLPKLGIGSPIRGSHIIRLILPGSVSTLAAFVVLYFSAGVLLEWLQLILAIGVGMIAAVAVAHRMLPEELALLAQKFRSKRE